MLWKIGTCVHSGEFRKSLACLMHDTCLRKKLWGSEDFAVEWPPDLAVTLTKQNDMAKGQSAMPEGCVSCYF